MLAFQNREAARRYAVAVIEPKSPLTDEELDKIDGYAASVKPGWFGNKPFDGDTGRARQYVLGPKPHDVSAIPLVLSVEEVDLARVGIYWRTTDLRPGEHRVPYHNGEAVIWVNSCDTAGFGPLYGVEIVRFEMAQPLVEPIASDEMRYKHIYDVVLFSNGLVFYRGLPFGEAYDTADFLAIRRGGAEYPLVRGDIVAVVNNETGAVHHAVGVTDTLDFVIQQAAIASDKHVGQIIRYFVRDPLHDNEWISYYSQWGRRWPAPRVVGDPRRLGEVIYSTERPKGACRSTLIDSIGIGLDRYRYENWRREFIFRE